MGFRAIPPPQSNFLPAKPSTRPAQPSAIPLRPSVTSCKPLHFSALLHADCNLQQHSMTLYHLSHDRNPLDFSTP